jgi:hypothetical protein
VDFLDKSLIENVIVKNCGRGFGVMTGGTLGGAGIGIGTGGMASENLVIANCQADGNGSYGIFTEDQSIFDGAFTYTGQGIIIANCIVKNTRNYGIGIKGGKGITVTNNQSYNNTKSGVYLNTVTLDSLVLTGNVIYGNVTSGVELNYSPSTISVKNIRITENIIKSNTVDGITFNGGTFENITISNNTLTENNIGLQVKGTNTFTNLTFERNLVKKNNSEGFVITTATNTINGLFIQFNKFIDNSVTASNKNAITLWNSATNISITDNIAWDTNATGSKKQNAGFGILGSPTFTNGQIMRNDFRFNIVTSGYVSTITQNILTNVVNDFLTPMGALYAPNTTINRYISLPKEVADFTGSTNFVIDVKFKYNGSNIVFLSKHNTAYTTDTRPKGWYFATSGAKLKLEGSAADATNALNLTGSTTLVSGNIYWARVVLDGTAATLKIQLSTDGTTYTDETVTGTLTAANVISVLGNADDMPSKIGVRYAGSTGFTDYYKNSEIHFINLFKVAAVTTGTPTMQYKFTNYGMNRNVIDEILGVSGTSYGLEQIKVY